MNLKKILNLTDKNRAEIGNISKMLITKAYDLFIEAKKEVFKERTIKKYITLKNIIISYEKKAKVHFTLEDVDSDFYEGLYRLCVNGIDGRKGLGNNSIERYF